MSLAGLLGQPILAADSTSKGQQEPPVVTASLALVQIDAVVTDAKGRHIEDLGCEDFEIYEDRRKQAITNCVFVRAPAPAILSPGGEARGAIGEPPVRREDVRRTMALVVDDLGLDLQSIVSVRTALEAFVQNQTAPGDMVSVIRTSGGASVLDQFTTDRRILRAAIERIRFSPWASVDVFEPMGSIPVLVSSATGPRVSLGTQPLGIRDRPRADTLVGGTVGILRLVLMGLKDLPGRKSVVVFSTGLPIRTPGGDLTPFGQALPALVDLANRASVVIYSVDTVGVVTGQLTAADNVNPPGIDQTIGAFQASLSTPGRAGARLSGLDGLAALSDPTGGLLLHGGNALSNHLGKVLEDQKGYYLLGYAPDASTFSPAGPLTFHKIQVKVRRKGMRVRSRSGFYGMTDDDPRVRGQREVAPLAAVLMSPFSSSEIGLSLSTLFYPDHSQRALLHSFLHVNAGDLTFAPDVDGTFHSRAEILACTFNADGQAVHQISRAGELRLTPEGRDVASRYGINYTIDVPVKKAGAYQLRVAIRDAASGHMGTAYQFVEVPDLGNGRLALSGILVMDAVSEGAEVVSEGPQLQSDDARAVATAARPAFAPGQAIAYGLTVYNARVDHPGGQASLQVQMRVLLEGKEVIRGEPRAVDTKGQENPKALFAGGILRLPLQMVSGQYALQVTVVDALAPPDRRSAVQAAAFEVEVQHAVQED